MANAIDLDADRHVLTGAEPFPQPVRAQPEADGIGSLLFAGDDFGADLGQRPTRIGERQKLIERIGIVQRMQPGRLQCADCALAKAGRQGGAGHRRTVSEQVCPYNCRSEEHTSELQSLLRISYAVFCSTKKYAMVILAWMT